MRTVCACCERPLVLSGTHILSPLDESPPILPGSRLPQLSHMPPELVLHGTMSRAVDVYSFGILLWQVRQGPCMWKGGHMCVLHVYGETQAHATRILEYKRRYYCMSL